MIQPDLREKVHIFDVKGREITMQAGVDAAQSKLADIQLAIQTKRYSKERVNALLP